MLIIVVPPVGNNSSTLLVSALLSENPMSTTPPPLPASLQGPIDTLLIDNFDSFTYNLYQQLLNLPSPYTPTSITVIRNNLLHPSHLPLLDPPPKRLIISPGPGNPDNEEDVGISIEAIKYFAGKIPVLGVCMGLECIVSCFGGRIAYAGEIMHGKVSHITHDARGLFKDIPQNFKSVRYHSLSAQTSNIPEELAICATTQESGVIMALRHRVYTVESVQYHPESFMSEGGDTLLCNFMSLKGGTWAMNPHLGVLDPSLPEFKPEKGKVDKGKETILQKIYTRTSHDVNTLSSTPGSTLASLKSALSLGLAPPLISFVDRLKAGVVPLPSHSVSHSPVRSRERDPTQNNNNNDEKPKTRNTYTYTPALLAEIKRASPSKGLINPSISAPHQALSYALAGASVISVLTEPHWFKGSKEDLLQTRLALSSLPYPTRPAVLRKDFILSPYQIYEARLWGADTVLLIVAMLPEETLVELVGVSRSLGMEPLIEVNSEKEMTLALSPLINAKVIGINNRNLHTFEVDMETTSRLASLALDQDQEKGEEVIVCALSGIEKRADVEPFLACGVKGILVGESLMRAKDVKAHVRSLLGLDIGIIGVGGGTGVSSPVPVLPTKEEGREGEEDEIPLELEQEPPEPLVKICGVRSVEDALMAAREGADMVGVIFVEGSMRCITLERARQISLALRSLGSVSNEVERVHRRSLSGVVAVGEGEGEMWFSRWAEGVRRGVRGGGRPLLVGVFQNAPISEITHFARVCMLDMVQLHGEEPVEVARWLSGVGVGVIRVLSVDKEEGGWKEEAMRTPGYHHHVLLDSPGGGTGEIFDWSYARRIVDAGELIAPFPPSETDAPPNTPKPTTEHPMPIILAGGLTPSNVRRAVEQVRPWCVDVSGGVEVGEKGSPKDAGKVRAFVRGAKGLDLDLGEMGVEMMGSGEDEDST